MFIVRVQMGGKESKVRTFSFETESDMDLAVNALWRMRVRGFGAQVDSVDATRGKVLTSWDHKDRHGRYWDSLSPVIQSGAYRDSIWEEYGSESECAKLAAECDAADVCYFSTHAYMERVAGDLFKVRFTTPYND